MVPFSDEKPLLLLVDDQPTNLHLLAATLREEYRIKVATSGEAALELCARADRPDLLLLDVMMPGMTGHEVLRHLRQTPETRDIPVIFVTADTSTSSELEGLALGADDYVTKPVVLPVLQARVRNLLQRRRAEAGLKLAASVFTFAHEGICITDANERIVDVNPTFVDVTGYSREELIGQTPRLLKSGRHGSDFYQAMWQALHRTGHWRGELWNRRKDGELFYELITISAVHDERGAVRHYVGIFSDITRLKDQELRLEQLPYLDQLTGLPNRTLLADRMAQALAQARRSGELLAVCYLDLDGFKAINDQYGRAAGNALLIEMAQRLRQTVRDGDTVARLGGDEFVLLLTLSDRAEGERMLRTLLDAVAAPVNLPLAEGTLEAALSASIGVRLLLAADHAGAEGEHGEHNLEPDTDTLLRQADQAMYQAKQGGRNRYALFDPEHDRRLADEQRQIGRLREALVKREFILHYQPKVHMREGRVVGAEALIRWLHPERGLLPPGQFLPLIDDHELVVDVGEWVIAAALEQMSRWQAEGLTLPVSVNIAARQLQHPDFIDGLRQQLARFPQVPPEWLELEVLESATLGDIALASRVIDACRALGVSFALDDFGTGYSSLAYLKRLPASVLKIDQSFVRDMLRDPEDRAIVAGVIGLTRAFNRSVIAEGVETEEHGAMLLQLGCDLAQGYGIARPMPAGEVATWAAAWEPYPSWREAPPALT